MEGMALTVICSIFLASAITTTTGMLPAPKVKILPETPAEEYWKSWLLKVRVQGSDKSVDYRIGSLIAPDVVLTAYDGKNKNLNNIHVLINGDVFSLVDIQVIEPYFMLLELAEAPLAMGFKYPRIPRHDARSSRGYTAVYIKPSVGTKSRTEISHVTVVGEGTCKDTEMSSRHRFGTGDVFCAKEHKPQTHSNIPMGSPYVAVGFHDEDVIFGVSIEYAQKMANYINVASFIPSIKMAHEIVMNDLRWNVIIGPNDVNGYPKCAGILIKPYQVITTYDCVDGVDRIEITIGQETVYATRDNIEDIAGSTHLVKIDLQQQLARGIALPRVSGKPANHRGYTLAYDPRNRNTNSLIDAHDVELTAGQSCHSAAKKGRWRKGYENGLIFCVQDFTKRTFSWGPLGSAYVERNIHGDIVVKGVFVGVTENLGIYYSLAALEEAI